MPMLRLQLLPDYIFETERVIRALIICGVTFVIVVIGTVKWLGSEKNKLENMKLQAAQATSYATEVKSYDDKIQKVKDEVKPYDDKRAYVESLRDFSGNWTRHMRMLSQYIYYRAEVTTATLTPAGFQLSVRTKSTDDVARLMMNLKRAYKANLIAKDSLNISGLTGWPNPTSPRGWGPDTRGHIEVPNGTGELSAVNANAGETSTVIGGPAAAPGAPGAPGGPSGGGGGPGMSGAPPSGGSSAPPSGGGSSGAPGGSGGAGGAGGTATAGFRLDRAPIEIALFLSSPMEAARRRHLQTSVEPPPQPYLTLSVAGLWATPMVVPQGGGAAGPAGSQPGMPGAPPGASGPSGPPSAPPPPPPTPSPSGKTP